MEEEIKQEYNKNRKKKILLIIIPILLLLIALAVALPLLLIKNDKKIVDIVFYQSSIFTIGQDLSNHVMIVTYEDDSTEQITFGDLTISDEDKASLSTVGEKVITITYKDFTKELDFLIVWNEFTDQEKQSMQVSDAFFEFDGNTQSVYLSSLPEGASAVYSVNNQDNFQSTYSVSEKGEYVIYVKVSKQDYEDYIFTFKISIVDTSADFDGFTQEEENLFTYRANSNLETFDIASVITLADQNAKYKIYSDEDLLNEVQANALPLNVGGGTSVFYLQVYFESNSLSRIYRIEISQAYSYQVNFYFKDEVIENIKVEENKTVSAPDFSREGYIISGWKVNDETVSFPLTINEDTDIYADYSLVDYNLSFTLNDGQIINSKTTYTIEDEDFTLPLPTKEGYDFLGWSGTDIEGMTLNVTIEKGSTGNREYTANWQIKTFTVNIPENQDVYTLTYDNLTVEYGGDFAFKVDLTDAYSQSTIVVKANGEELTLQGEYYTISNITQNVDVTIDGYKLNEYTVTFTENDSAYQIDKTGDTVTHGGEYKFKIELEPAYSDSTIVVKAGEETLIIGDDGYYTIENVTQNVDVTIDGYKLNEYTVTFTENDSAYQIDKTGDTVTHGGEYKFKIELEPAYSDSTIVVKAGEETLIIGEDGYYTIENVTQNVGVVIEGATINTYTIKWLNYDGSVLETDENVQYGTMPTYDGTIPTKPESASHTYTFSDWDSEIELATSDKEYRAQFSETIKTFAVNFGSNITVLVEGEPIMSGERLDYGTSVTISYSESLGYQKSSFKVNGDEQENNYSIQVTEQITVEYSESAINYTLTYNLDSGSLSGQKESYTIEDETFTLPTPTKQGYEFLGWSGTGLEEITKTVTIEKGSTGNREYTANWQILQFTYSFYNGDELLKTETVDYGSAIVQPDTIPTKASIDGVNYVFSGWNPEVPEHISDKNLTFYAKFTEQHFTRGLNFTYSAFDDAYIVDIGSVQDATITVPATYNNKNVVEVKADGFANSATLNSITFEGNINTIGKGAFANCPNLNSIKGLDNITSIPQSAFEGDTSLTEFDIGDKVLAIGERAFANSGLTTVNIPSSVIAIENGAFDGCQITAYTVDENNSNYATNGDGNLYNKNFTEIILYAHGNTQTTFSLPSTVQTVKSGAFINSQSTSAQNSQSRTGEISLENLIITKSTRIIEDNAIPSTITLYTEFSQTPEGWSAQLKENNTIYYQDTWELQDGQPIVTLPASEFKTGIYTNWQSYIDDDVRFLDVVTPGSHDAGTQTITAVNLHTQGSDIYDQLIGGVRYFDMRVAEFNGQVRCIHANSSEDISNDNGTGLIFEDVLDDMKLFIADNPSEILILDFQHLWDDFEREVVPLIESLLPQGQLLKKSQFANLSTLTMGQLREANVHYVIIVQDDASELDKSPVPNFDSYDWMYKRTQVLKSQYDGDIHHDSADDLINHWEVYFNNFEEGKIFILQSQLTAQNGLDGINHENNLIEREKSIRNKGNNYVRSLSLEKNQDKLNKLNIIMRDFVVDDLDGVDSAKVSIQSILFLNVYKGNISTDKLNYYKILLDFERVDNLSKSY